MITKEYAQAKITIKGLVQGVSFRLYTKRKAHSLGLTGVVRNLENGDVEVIAEGTKIQIAQLIKWLRNEGSPNSNVQRVIVDWTEKLGNYNSFRAIF